MMNSVFDLSEVDEQARLSSEQLEQTKADLQMEAILNEIQLGVDGLLDPDQVLEIPTNGDPYCPITGEERVSHLIQRR